MRAAPPRIVVTGLGAVSGWGYGIDALWRGLLSGEHAIGPLRRFETSGYPSEVGSEVPQPRSEARHSVADAFALAASAEALAAAGLPADLSVVEAGLFFGSSTGGMFECERFYERIVEGGPASRALIASQQLGAPGEAVARRHRIHGPVQSSSAACSSATLAIGRALDALRDGTIDVALAGGSDSLCRVTYAGFNALRSVDPKPARPFRADRAGLSLGEGSAVLVLESERSARARGARPLATLSGAGASCDAHHMTAPEPSGAGTAPAIAAALDDARLAPDAIDFVNAHGTGTPLNDAAEYRALAAIFGSRASSIPLSAIKASVGHLLGSAGAIEAAATVLSLRDQQLPPVPGPDEVDPELPVDLVRGAARRGHYRAALSTNLAFGGCNAALVFER